MNIVVYDGDLIYRKNLSNVIDGILINRNSNSQIVLDTDDPCQVMRYTQTEKLVTLYFIDAALDAQITGLELARNIRENDAASLIVIIANNSDAMRMAYDYKVEALDFIFKGESQELLSKTSQCIAVAEQRQMYGYADCINIQTHSANLSVAYDDIYYIDTALTRHKLAIHTCNSMYDFYGKLSDMTKLLDNRFYKCHKSVIVNHEKIIGVYKREHQLLLINGSVCPYSNRFFKPNSICN